MAGDKFGKEKWEALNLPSADDLVVCRIDAPWGADDKELEALLAGACAGSEAASMGLFASALAYVAVHGHSDGGCIGIDGLLGDGIETLGDLARAIIAFADGISPAEPEEAPDGDDGSRDGEGEGGDNARDATPPIRKSMRCRDLATVLLAVDREAMDSGLNSFDASRRFPSGQASQLCNIADALMFIEKHGLESLRIPLVPFLGCVSRFVSSKQQSLSFIRSKFGRANFSFDENGTPILMGMEKKQLSLTNEAVADRLSALYACFDQRFEAIFYPTSKRELAMLSCAATTSVASAIWQSVSLHGIPETADADWLGQALLGRERVSLRARACKELLDNAAEGFTCEGETMPWAGSEAAEAREEISQCRTELALRALEGAGIIDAPKDGQTWLDALSHDPGSLWEKLPAAAIGYDAGDDEEAARLHELHMELTSTDAAPYPAMPVPDALDPTDDAIALVLEACAASAFLPGPADVIAKYLLAFSSSLGADEGGPVNGVARAYASSLVPSMLGECVRRACIRNGSYKVAEGSSSRTCYVSVADGSAVVTKDAQLQYVLRMMLKDGFKKGTEIPLSFKQLAAIVMGFKTDRLKQALMSDFGLSGAKSASGRQMGEATSVFSMVSRIVDGIDDGAIRREASLYGEADVDPIRTTIAAMAMPDRMPSAESRKLQLTPQHLMSLLIEMPSAFSDAYGNVSGNRMLAAYTRSGGQNISSSIKVYQPVFMLNDDWRFGSRTMRTDKPENDTFGKVLLSRFMPGELPIWTRLLDAEQDGLEGIDRLLGGSLLAVIGDVSGEDGGTEGFDLVADTLTEHSDAIAAARSMSRYEVSPSIVRMADSLFRHHSRSYANWMLGKADIDAFRRTSTVEYGECVVLACVIHILIDMGTLPDSIPTAYGTMFEATYPRSWEGCERMSTTEPEQQEAIKAADSETSTTKERVNKILSRGADLRKLLACSFDMTAAAAESENVVVERDKELQEVISVLLRREKSNAIILGEAGTGKTALVELLASAIAEGKVPERLRSKRLLQMDTMTISSMPETTVAEIFEDARGKDVILFMDEIHTLKPGTMNALKPYLARGDISLIGATTNSEYQATILKDKALARRFSSIRLHELNQEQTIVCLKMRMKEYEQWYGVSYDTKTPYAIAAAASTYMTNRHSPDRELDVLDVAGSIASMDNRTVVVEDDAYTAVRQLTSNRGVLSMNDVRQSIASESGDLSERVERAFGDIVSQDEPKRIVSERLAISQIGMRAGGSPKNVLMFVGPSGVGKTMMAERIPKFLGLNDDTVLSLNMSEFARGHEYSRLVGSPPGYIAYEQGGILTNFGMAHPDGVIIFDEIEKAAPKVRQMLLNLFDKGYIDSASGERVDCRSMTLICTSNAGFASVSSSRKVGFMGDNTPPSYADQVDSARAALVKELTAPFVGRFDEIVVFSELSVQDILQSCRNEYASLAERYEKNRGIDVAEFFSHDDLDRLLRSVSEKEVAEVGARSIMRRIDTEIQKAIAGIR